MINSSLCLSSKNTNNNEEIQQQYSFVYNQMVPSIDTFKNNSIKHESFVYTHVNVKTVLLNA